MKTYIRSETEAFTLDNAISAVFGFSSSVEKVFNHHTTGTIEVDGKPFDWFMHADFFEFVEAK